MNPNHEGGNMSDRLRYPVYSTGPRGGLFVTCPCGTSGRGRWGANCWHCPGCHAAWHGGEPPTRNLLEALLSPEGAPLRLWISDPLPGDAVSFWYDPPYRDRTGNRIPAGFWCTDCDVSVESAPCRTHQPAAYAAMDAEEVG
jgi:hypothetical protein